MSELAMRFSIILFFSAACIAAGASAAGIPDRNQVRVPDMSGSGSSKSISDSWKYFYFYKTGVSYENAYADFADCYRYLATTAEPNVSLPAFVAWPAQPTEVRRPQAGGYGVVGNLLIDAFADPLRQRAQQVRMRRCLEPKGYKRFPIEKLVWEQLIDRYSEASIATQAKLASGDRPVTQEALN